MSTSKHIDLVCLLGALFALLLTAAFINGEALGITPIADGDAGDGQFTANDRNADWDRTGATRITLADGGSSVQGNGAYVYGGDVHIVYAGRYILSGALSDGSVIIDADSNDKVWILLDGVSLHREDSAALIVEQAGKVFLTLADGRSNSISSGAEYAEEAVSSGIDGAIYSRDDLTINGGGSLSVTAEYRHAIVCNDDLVIAGGTIDVTAAQDGLHANDSARLADADITINAGDDGITVSNDDESAYIYIESGNISIPSCYEGIEAIDITIAGGVIDIRPTDDGINANGRGINSIIRITGGDITIINENGRDADGLDSNGDIDISGGNIFISVNSGSYALDYGSENGGVCKISGGTVIAAGGSAMAEGFDSSSEQNFIMHTTSAGSAGAALALKNAAGDVLLSGVIPCAFSSVVLSTPELRLGETCTISIGGAEEEITVDNTSSGGGFGGFGMGGTRGMGGGRGMARFSNTDGTAPDIPDLPDRDAGGSGEMPERPDARDAFGAGGFRQGGGAPDREDVSEMPEPPGWDAPDARDAGRQEGWQFPADWQGGPGGDFRRGGGQFAQQWENPADAAGEASPLSAEALALVGVSALCLLAGILFALKVKH